MVFQEWKTEEFKKIDVRGVQGKDRIEICEMLKERFGEKNPDVKVQ